MDGVSAVSVLFLRRAGLGSSHLLLTVERNMPSLLSAIERRRDVGEERGTMLQGTLELLVLKIVSLEPIHGWGITLRMEQMSASVFQVNQGSLYPALERLTRRGWLRSEWRTTESNRRARYYELTPCRQATARRGAAGMGALVHRGQCDPFVERSASMTSHDERPRWLPAWLPAWLPVWVRWPFGGARADRDHQEEVRFHLDMAAARFEAQGIDPVEARRRAAVALGGATRVREEASEARGGRWFADLGRDARYAVRQLRHARGFAVVAILTLALGIGANTALFSVIEGVLLRPIPFPDADRLAVVWETDRVSGTSREPASWPDYVDFARDSRTFSQLAAVTGLESSFTPAQGEAQRVSTMAVTHSYFPLVGVRAMRGRIFTPEEDVPGGALVVLLGERFWRARFNADPSIIGQTVRIDEVPRQVVGIVPVGSDFGLDQLHARADYHGAFSGSGDVAIWIPMQGSEREYPRDTHPFFVLGRLAESTTLPLAGEEMDGVAKGLEERYRSNTARGVHVEALSDVVFAPVRPVLYLLLGAVALVLLVACVNVANLFLARGAARMREVAVRSALGAGVSRLGRQFVVEALLLSVAGGAAGVALAWFGLRALLAFAPADLPRVDEIGINAPVLLATLGVSLLVGLVFGLVPTVQALRVDVNETLKGEARGGTAGVGRRRLREVLVVTELALSVTLVLCAGLLVRSVSQVLHVDPGFNAAGVLKAEFTLPPARYPRDYRRYPDWPATRQFARRVAAARR